MDFNSISMANLVPKLTGLKADLWVDTVASGRKISHSKFRVKFGNFPNFVSITFIRKGEYHIIGDMKKAKLKEKEIMQAKEWIDKNYNALVDLYVGKIHIGEFIAAIV